ncbi:T9SS type A sorting domain-containing protein [candidate division WOR-3 bacterium]|nr:T9SS type A sorting domain-containing protein [candidate division WOR-3 bacterium]
MYSLYRKVFFMGIVLFLGVTGLFAQAPGVEWSRTYGGSDVDEAYSVQQTTDGGFIVAGYTKSYGAGSEDIWVIKTNFIGDTLWTRTFGCEYNDYGYSIKQTLDGGYIIAGYNAYEPYGFYLIKLNSSGDTLWTKTYGHAMATPAYSVQQTSDGGYIAVGQVSSWWSYYYLIKTDSLGYILWERSNYQGAVNSGGFSVQQTSDGGYIVAGRTDLLNPGPPDKVYLLKTDTLGIEDWSTTFGSDNDTSQAYSVQQTSDGGYIIAAGKNSNEIWLIKTNTNGDTIWTKTYEGATCGVGDPLVRQTPDGGFVVTGAKDGEVYLIRTDSLGNTLWTEKYGEGRGRSVQRTSDGGYIIAGTSGGDVYLIRTERDYTGIEEEEFSARVFFVSQCKPNPFTDKTMIKYSLPQSSRVRISVYNLLGQETRELVNQREQAGVHTVEWDSKDNTGEKVSSGVYILKIKAGKNKASRKLFLLR